MTGADDLQRRVLRRQLLWQGLVGAGALATGPALLRRPAPTAPASLDLTRARLVASVAAPPIVSRSGWGADERLRRGSPDYAPIRRVIVHHTVTATNEPDPAARVRAIHAFHVQGTGWSDIGYNFLVDQAGRIYEGRAGAVGGHGEDRSGRGVIGAHAEGHNTGSVGVAILGTFTDDRATPSDAALEAVAAVAAWKLGTRGIDPLASGALIGHRDVVATGCPGNGCQRRLGQVRERTRERIAAAGQGDGGGGLVQELLETVGGLL